MKSLNQFVQEYFEEAKGLLASFYPGLREETFKRELELYLFGVESEQNERLKETPYLKGIQQNVSKFINQVEKGTPLPYITGKSYFYRNEFLVNSDVLIPRSETEILVEDASHFLKQNQNGSTQHVLEVGTGSGALILSLLSEIDFGVSATASDISSKALDVARKNFFLLKFGIHSGTTLDFICSDRLSFLEDKEQKFDLIVSNPPYIKRKGDFSLVHPKVHEFEPHEALYLDDENYNSWFETFFLQVRSSLKAGGAFLMEGHENHLNELKDLAETLCFKNVELKKDYCDRWRFLKIKN